MSMRVVVLTSRLATCSGPLEVGGGGESRLCWTRVGVVSQRDTAQGCLTTLNASPGRELDDAPVGMPMRFVVVKSRLATGRVMEVECGVVV